MEVYDKDGNVIEKPEAGQTYFDKDGKEIPPTAEGDNQQSSVEKLQEDIKRLQDGIQALEREKKGIYGDLKSEKERRQDLERRIQEKERAIEGKEDLIDSLEDDEYITAKHLKAIRKTEQARTAQAIRAHAIQRGEERMADDENRMIELCELNPKKYPIPYEEAIEEFEKLAKEDASLWDDVDKAKYRAGGKPAEVAYRIALRESSKFKDADRKKVREEVIEELNQQERNPQKLRGGGGQKGKSLDQMTDRDIMAMSDEELQRAMRT